MKPLPFILPLVLLGTPCILPSAADRVLSRVVTTKYGKVQGIIRHHSRPTLPPVELYLGIPYASPPIGEGRFTPTSSPLPWDYVKKCHDLPPVCPQPLWGDEGHLKSKSIPEDIELYYSFVRPLLKNQNEDCLYLNIYAPHDGGGKYPVMVYIHGDSFSWGSGNLYDGGTLSSYGQVVVVTVNYRLGPLGFLNSSPGGSRTGVVSNQGLMDQLAALSWVQENIAVFGGDPTRVTLIGHSTGAACVGYLIASPVLVPGLFHRAILMSGSPLSPWAEVSDALSVTIRLAKQLNCSVPTDLSRKHPETIACLRNVTSRQLVDAVMPRYKFASLFGPSVDGVVIPENFKERLTQTRRNGRIRLMFGVTEGDAYPELTAMQAKNGLSLGERNKIFRTFVRNTFQHHLQEIYLAIAKEYTDWENPTQHPLQIRDWTLGALSDGGFVAPLIKFADLVSSGSDSFMYVFSHHDQRRESLRSVFRSEIPLLFGAPFQDNQFSSLSASSSSSSSYQRPPSTRSRFSSLASSSSSSASSTSSSSGLFAPPIMTSWSNFSKTDAIVSEYLMRYWTNFAKSGHPDLPDDPRPSLGFRERESYKNVSWEEYDQVFEKFLEISSRPRMLDHFRAHKVALWNWLLPELEDAGSKYPEAESELWHTSEDGKYFIGPVKPLDPFRFLHPTRYSPTIDTPSPSNVVNGYLAPNVSAAQGSLNRDLNATKSNTLEEGGPLLDYTTALTLTVAIGLSLLVLNVILFAALLYKRERTNVGPKMKYDSVSAQPLCTVDSGLRSTPTPHETLTPPGKEIQSCSSTDPQCTELHTFPTPPDIGDRNTEVTFHNSSSVHSVLSQPTSQFIPPPPLLSTTPPTPPTGAMTAEGVEGAACGQSRCFPDVGAGSFNDTISHYPSDSPSQYPIEIGESTYPSGIGSPKFIPESSPGGYHVEQYVGSPQCVESQSCPVSTSCAYPTSTSQCPSGQYCHAQYTTSVGQYPSTPEQYSDTPGQYSSPGCQFTSKKDHSSGRFYPDSSFSEAGQGSPGQGTSGRSSNARTSTLTRQSGSSSGNGTGTSLRKPQPPARGAALPSYATLPRKDLKD